MGMTKKKITLEDGRYLIYYTFESKETPKQADATKKRCDQKCCGGAK